MRLHSILAVLSAGLPAMSLAVLLGCGGGSARQPPPQVAWLQRAAKPLASSLPTAPDHELACLEPLVAGADIVGMGEATHGSSEFQTMKHRVFQYMVEHHGVRAFGLEAQMGRCQAIDDYLQTGQGDPAVLLKEQGFWVWSTQEMLDLVTWMRAYNANAAHAEKLHLVGFDMQDGGAEMDRVLAYLHPIDSPAEASLEQLYAPYRPYTWDGGPQNYRSAPAGTQSQCHDNLQQALQWLIDHQAAYTAATGAAAYAWALQSARVVVQNEAHNSKSYATWDPYNIRDRAMADNVEWYHQQFGAKMVLSAHNGHLNKKGLYVDWTNTGDWLSQWHGSGYASIGFAFDAGAFNAILVNPDGSYGSLQPNTVPPAAPGSYEEAFAQLGMDAAFLDMRGLDASQPGPAWFLKSHNLLEVGAAWGTSPDFAAGPTVLPDRFHGLIFLKRVKATTFLP